MEPMCSVVHGVIYYPWLKDRLATYFVWFPESEKDAAAGTLPIRVDPAGHHRWYGDYGTRRFGAGHLRRQRRHRAGTVVRRCWAARAFLERIFNADRLNHLTVRHQRVEDDPADRVGRSQAGNLRPTPPPDRVPLPDLPASVG